MNDRAQRPPQPGDEYVEPTRRGRVVALWLFAIGVGSGLALMVSWPLLMAHIRSLPVCGQLPWFTSVIGVQAVLMAAIPAWLLWAGLACRRSARWPPPRMLVLRRTRVLHGAPALRRAGWLIGGAAVSGIAFVLLVARLFALVADIAAAWRC